MPSIIDRWVNRFLGRRQEIKPIVADESLGPARLGEIRPPWIEYPGFGPDDFFWRDAGQSWRDHVWDPYYKSLTPEQQTEYLAYWKVPDEWWNFYFDPEYQAFWDSVDNEEE